MDRGLADGTGAVSYTHLGQLAQVEQYQRYLQSTAHWNAYLAGAVERRRQETQAVRFGGGGGIASLGGGGGASGGGGIGTR